MRFTGLFAAATLAASALASPIAQSYQEGASPASPSGDSASPSGSAVDSASPEEVASEIEVPSSAPSVVVPQNPAPTGSYKEHHVKTVESCDEVIVLFEEHVQSVKECTHKINSTVEQYEEGEVSEDDANTDIIAVLEEIEGLLEEIVEALTGAAGIPIKAGELDKLLSLINILIAELLATVNAVVKALGLGGALSKLLHVVFGLLAKILHLLIGLLAGILPGLVAILTPLLSGLGKGLLGPILQPVLGRVDGLADIL